MGPRPHYFFKAFQMIFMWWQIWKSLVSRSGNQTLTIGWRKFLENNMVQCKALTTVLEAWVKADPISFNTSSTKRFSSEWITWIIVSPFINRPDYILGSTKPLFISQILTEFHAVCWAQNDLGQRKPHQKPLNWLYQTLYFIEHIDNCTWNFPPG